MFMENPRAAATTSAATVALGQFARFAVVGASGVAVNMAALFVLHGVAGLPLVIASAAAVEVAIVHNFVWNHRWTFGRRALALVPFLRFNTVSLAGLVIATSILWVLVTLGGLHYLVANAAGVGVATCWNFLVNLRWTWGRAEGAA